MRKAILALAVLLIASTFKTSTNGQAQGSPLLAGNPSLSKTQIVFAYAGDLWVVSRDGGQANRLTAGVGTEGEPLFSPDGNTIAFTGDYDGNVDVYTVPAVGGIPRRLTYHPGTDRAVAWTPDGKQVLFTSQRGSYSSRFARLYTMATDGVFPSEVPLPMAYEGSYSADATKLAYEPIPRAFAAWKRYRGGMATQIWIANLSDSRVEKIPRTDSNDFNPMWVDDKIYFLSDRNGSTTLFSYDTKTKKITQLIANNGSGDLDIKTAAAGPDGIVYERFGSIHLYNMKSGTSKKINVTVNGDMLAMRPKFEKVGTRIVNPAISPTGARAVFEARGEIITVPAEKGNARNLTNTAGVAERDPSWSPDGNWIAYFSDESGEYALQLRDQTGLGDVKKIDLGEKPSFFYNPTWSPDSKKIAYTDKRLNIWYVDIDKGAPVKVDNLNRGATGLNWSPDSRWLVYTKPLQSWYAAVFVYSLEDGKSTQITDGLSDAGHPVFDKGGKHLFFTGSTDIGPRVFSFDMSSYPHRPTRNVYGIVLRKTDPSPLAPESDEEKIGEERKEEKKEEKNEEKNENGSDKSAEKPGEESASKPAEKKEPPAVTIDFDTINQRVLALPIPNRNYVRLEAGKANTLFIVEGNDPAQGGTGNTLHKFDIEKRKLDKAIESLNAFELSFNGEKMLYRQNDNWYIAASSQLGTPSFKPGEGKIRIEEMEVYVDPRAEWDQMYRETWRIERDFFYDPSHHGLDLKATAKKYEPYLASVQHRSDLNYLFAEMLGELSVGHLYVNGGDVPDPKRVPGGLLGADYRIENGRYRFHRVYNGENWNPQLRAPLTQPGVNVAAGEYLLAVNGRNLAATDNLYSFFENTANKQVVIRVGPNPDGSNSREVKVVPVPNENGLRNLAWIEENRRKVDTMSNGKLAYIYLPDTAQGGYTFFNRYYFSQLDKQGAVVDERFNSGGQAADYIIDYLTKPLMSYWAVRDGDDFRQPFGAMPGPKAMLLNEYSGSGGDYLPYMFRRAKVGPLIGTRTWGGLVGIGGYPTLIDGGSVTAPHFAFYTPEGKWEIENHGVHPDVEIEFDPAAWRQGRDPQLERAVEWLLGELKKNPTTTIQRPAYPNYQIPRTPGQ
ncbi:MAG TPA: PDZ domain-containing protein [Terriglobia bacterium]|nr:PDZ domain-containing protein [Terriglobia bacterium]